MAVKGNLIIVSGPSGAGKSALVASVLPGVPRMEFSISYTTRPPRGSERDGVEYHFVTQEDFDRLIQGGDLLEWAVVYGNYYGTSRRRIETALEAGRDVLLDVDVQGARTIRQQCPDSLSVFILPPSPKVLRMRLESRSLDKDYVIEQRLKIASEEIQHYRSYDFLIVNDEFESSVQSLKAIILGNRCRLATQREVADGIAAHFGGANAELS